MHQFKNDFPIFNSNPLVYLDSAATTQKPSFVIDKISKFYQNEYGTVHRGVYKLSREATAQYEGTRNALKLLLNAAINEEIIFTRGTTESINMVAYSFGKAFIKPGDEILISEMEHHSNIVPWQILCEDRGCVLKVIPFDDRGVLDLLAFEKLLSPKTKLVAVTHISNVLGTINPIKEMAKMAHAVNAKILVDGAQSTPHKQVDVQDLDVDFYVFSGHKMYGPTGIGVLYGKEALLNAMPPYQGGGDMIETVSFQKTTYNALPLKFEAGTPMIAEVIGLKAAIEYVQKIGLQNISQHEHELLCEATKKLKEIPGIKILGEAENKGPILTFTVQNIHPLDLATLLDAERIAVRSGHLCAQPIMRHFGVTSALRASFGLYNTMEDIDFFIKTLQKAIRSLLR